MNFTEHQIKGLISVEPRIFEDTRGYFFEAYNESLFHKNGIRSHFVQDNQSKSSGGVIRGLHYQQNPFAQAKLVRVLLGAIMDVAVDIRKGSPTFGQHLAIELSAENNRQLFIPAGFAHGFSVLSPTAVVMYKCDQVYNKESEGGIRYNDEELGIDWMVPGTALTVSDKDLQLPSFSESIHNFQF